MRTLCLCLCLVGCGTSEAPSEPVATPPAAAPTEVVSTERPIAAAEGAVAETEAPAAEGEQTADDWMDEFERDLPVSKERPVWVDELVAKKKKELEPPDTPNKRVIADPPTLLPHRGTDGEVDGYRVSGLSPAHPLASMGVSEGDILHSVGGSDSLDALEFALANLSSDSPQQPRIEVVRDGKVVTP